MPTYNRAGLIVDSIKSIRRQTYSNSELFIIDDGSSNNTEEVVLAFEDPRIHFSKVARTGVVGKLKNLGLSKATGNLIVFIDSDDMWNETKIEKQIAALQLYNEAGFCLLADIISKPQPGYQILLPKKRWG